ncbi:DUF4062 domain-containing protein [Hungatella hathewayi]|uniref:DUF4062 domain-containing protein n=1 Tax=Hungatella hathewayi TaxID=154046 RepID=UPI00356465AE
MEKRYQIFVSSTYRDLAKEREAVMDVITGMRCFPIGMESFPANDMKQFDYIKQLIDESDYYILILSHNYGTLAEDGYSYTEKEYDYALKKKIPVLAFIKREADGSYGDNLDEGVDKLKKLTDFRDKVMKNRLIAMWTDIGNLKYHVKNSLEEAFKSRKRTGWVKYSNELERIKDRKPVNLFIKDARKEVFITGNALNSTYDSVTEIQRLLKKGVTIKMVLLSQENLKENCQQLGAGYKKMIDLISNTLIRLKTYQTEYLGTQLLVREISTPIWTNIIAKDAEEKYGIIGANHLLYDTPPVDCLYLEFDSSDKYFGVYKDYMNYLWDSGREVDFTKVPTEFE